MDGTPQQAACYANLVFAGGAHDGGKEYNRMYAQTYRDIQGLAALFRICGETGDGWVREMDAHPRFSLDLEPVETHAPQAAGRILGCGNAASNVGPTVPLMIDRYRQGGKADPSFFLYCDLFFRSRSVSPWFVLVGP